MVKIMDLNLFVCLRGLFKDRALGKLVSSEDDFAHLVPPSSGNFFL